MRLYNRRLDNDRDTAAPYHQLRQAAAESLAARREAEARAAHPLPHLCPREAAVEAETGAPLVVRKDLTAHALRVAVRCV